MRTLFRGFSRGYHLKSMPKLAEEGMESIKHDKAEKQLKQLISREKIRRMYRILSKMLNKNEGKGLRWIDVPDAAASTEGTGDPNCPKTWKGPWKSVTNPTEIAKAVCRVNADQYHQAHLTPFSSGPVADIIGRGGDMPASVDLLRGHLPDLPSSTLPETIRILQTLAQQHPTVTGLAIISPEEFVSTYTAASEQTLSSPSGCHIGHYKAVLDDSIQVHSTLE
jgi:hypothetical protein